MRGRSWGEQKRQIAGRTEDAGSNTGQQPEVPGLITATALCPKIRRGASQRKQTKELPTRSREI
jgi:hypothetical protein